MAWPGQPTVAGTLSTADGLVFTGAATTREVMAVAADTGQTLWQFQTGSGIDGLPETRQRKGQQYVTITSNSERVWALISDGRMAKTPAGGSLWTFAVG